jgi:peptidoglycan/LPS O-acetylase OafA/YrhL
VAPLPIDGHADARGAAAHLPALDGLRGVAILLVLFFHMTVMVPVAAPDHWVRSVMGHGWVGVDLFFVLSGFLITGILLDTKGEAHYFRNFYARRALRIFPMYYAVIAFYLLVLPAIAPGLSARLGHVEGSGWYYWFYLSNHAIAHSTVEGGDMRFGPLNPTWSLAVEEQFYLVWPLVVLLFSRRALAARVLPGVIVAVIALRVTLVARHVSWGYLATLTPCRLDSLATGAWVACLARSARGREALLRWAAPAVLLAAGGLAVIAVQNPLGFRHSELRYSFGFTCVAMLSAAALICAISLPAGHPFVRALSRPGLMAFGKYSYALYLLHTPVQAMIGSYVYGPSRFLRWGASPLPGQLLFYGICLATFFVTAWTSWHLYEKHFLKLKRLFPMPRRPLEMAPGVPATFAPPGPVAVTPTSAPAVAPA